MTDASLLTLAIRIAAGARRKSNGRAPQQSSLSERRLFLNAIGLTLPYAAAIALGPITIVAAILTVSGSSSRAAGWLFALGWLLGIAILSAVIAVLVDKAGDGEQKPVVNILRIVVGLLLLWWGVRKFLKWRSADAEAAPPKWLQGFSDMGPAKALRLGATLAALNPKHFAFVAAGMSSFSYASGSTPELVAIIACFTFLSASTVIGVVILSALGGGKAQAMLEAAKQFMLRNNNVIVATVLVILGASILGSGVSGFSG